MFDYKKLSTQRRERRSWKSKRQNQSRRLPEASFRYLALVLEYSPSSSEDDHA